MGHGERSLLLSQSHSMPRDPASSYRSVLPSRDDGRSKKETSYHTPVLVGVRTCLVLLLSITVLHLFFAADWGKSGRQISLFLPFMMKKNTHRLLRF